METPAPTRSAPSRGLLFLAFAAVCLAWGTTFLAIRYAVETIPPLITAGVRHAVAGTVLLALAWLRGYRPRRSDWIAGSVIGALFFLAGHGLLHWAELHIASGLAALLIATEPLWIHALGAALGRQRLSLASGPGLLLGLAIFAGWMWAGEPLGGHLALAAVVVVAAVVLVQRGERAEPRDEGAPAAAE